MSENTFGARSTLSVDGRDYEIFRLDAVPGDVERLPYSLRVLLENLLRMEDGLAVTADDIRALAGWSPDAPPGSEIAFMPARVLLQDFTGVPAVVDLATMRDAMAALGGGRRAGRAGAARGAGDRPFRPGRRLGVARRVRDQPPARLRAQP